jgi:hypothetical protein
MWVCFQKHSFFSSSIKSIIEREEFEARFWNSLSSKLSERNSKKRFSESSFLEEEEESVLSTYK